MMLKNIFKFSLLVVALTVFFTSVNFAQTPVLNTVYVNSTNGDDGYTGENAINDPAGTGPKRTLEGGFAAAKAGATIYVAGGTYDLDESARTDANGIGGGNDADGVSFAPGTAKAVTFFVQTFSSFSAVTIPAGLTVNNNGKIIAFQPTTSGVEGVVLTGLTLTAGTLDMSALDSKFVMNAGTTTRANGTLVGSPAFASSDNYTVEYTNTIAITAGPELPADINSGELRFSGTKLVTVPQNVLSSNGRIRANAGSSGTITGTVTFDAAATDGKGIEVANGGTLTLGTVLIKHKNKPNYTYVEVEGANGTLTINSLTVQNTSTSASSDGPIAITVVNAGTMTIGSVAEIYASTSTSATNVAKITIVNSGAKTLTLGTTTITGPITNTGGGILKLTGNVTTPDVLDNTGSTIQLGAYTLTLTGSVTHVNTGGTITDAGGKLVFNKNAAITVTGGGTFATTENANTGLVTISGVNTFSGNLVSTKGGFTLQGQATLAKDVNVVAGTVTFANAANQVQNILLTGGKIDLNANTFTCNGNITQSGGVFDYGTATLVLKGNLTRTGGTLEPMPVNTGALQFAASGAQAFNGGANYQVNDLSVTGISSVVTLQSSIIVNGDASIGATNTMTLGTNNIRMAGDNATFTLAGSYTSSGGGGIIFEAPTADQTLSGTGIYSNIEVKLGDYTKSVIILDEVVKFSGILTTTSGGILLDATGANAGLDPVNTLVVPSVRVNVADASGAAGNQPRGTGVQLAGSLGGTEVFNSLGTKYHLEYFGAITTSQLVTDEYVVGDLLSLTVNTSIGTLDLPDADATMSGDLTVGPGATLTMASSVARTYTLDKDGGVYSIRGIIDFNTAGNGDVLSIDGPTATITGWTTTGDPAKVDALLDINSSTLATVSGIRRFEQAITTGATSIVDFGMKYVSAGDELNGLLTIGGTLNLTTKIFADAGLTVAAGGTFNLGNYDVEVKNITPTTITTNEDLVSTGGKLYINGKDTNLDANGKDVPYLSVKGATLTLLSDVSSSGLVDILASGVVDDGNNGYVISISNKIKTVDGATITGDAIVEFTGSTLEINDAGSTATVTWPNVTINSDSTTTIVSVTDDEMTLEISQVLTQTKGNLDLGDHSIALLGDAATYADAFVRTEGEILQGDGALIFGGTLDQTFEAGADWSIKNLTIDNSAGSGTEVTTTASAGDDPFTVTGNLNLVSGTLSTGDDGLLHLANGATINIDAANSSLSGEVPTFDGVVNVTYQTTGGTTDIELPSDATTLNNLKISIATTLADNVTVNGSLILDAGLLTLGGNTVTIDSGATIVRKAGTISDDPTVTNYNLTYTGNVNSAKEFVSGKVDLLTVAKNITLTMTANKTVKNIDLSAEGSEIDVDGNALTSTGNLNLTNGTITDGSGGGQLVLGGTALQTITAAATGTAFNGAVKLDNAAGFQLAGGNLSTGHMTFTKGIFTTGNYILYLPAPTVGAVAADPENVSQGFKGAGPASHVVGNVAKTLTNNGTINGSSEARNVFPVGNGTIYRPAAITFNPAFGVPTTPNMTVVVKYVDANPSGAVALPITNGIAEGIDVVRYPNFYWAINTLPSSIGPSTYFDLELTAAAFSEFDDINNVRIIRRHGTATDITNQWLLQGTNSNYDNEISSGVPSIINVGSNAGLRLGGAIFTLGLKSKMSIANPIPDQVLVKENGSKIISLANVFQGQTGTLTYSVQSSNETVVKPLLFPNSSNLALNPIAVGDAVITVIARDNANTDFYVAHFAVEVTSTVGVDETEELPTEYALYQNFPNPFNPTTNIKFALPNESNVTLKIYNILGEEVATLVNKVMNAGFHTVSFDASKLTSGMYIYRIEAENFVQVKKMLLMK